VAPPGARREERAEGGRGWREEDKGNILALLALGAGALIVPPGATLTVVSGARGAPPGLTLALPLDQGTLSLDPACLGLSVQTIPGGEATWQGRLMHVIVADGIKLGGASRIVVADNDEEFCGGLALVSTRDITLLGAARIHTRGGRTFGERSLSFTDVGSLPDGETCSAIVDANVSQPTGIRAPFLPPPAVLDGFSLIGEVLPGAKPHFGARSARFATVGVGRAMWVRGSGREVALIDPVEQLVDKHNIDGLAVSEDGNAATIAVAVARAEGARDVVFLAITSTALPLDTELGDSSRGSGRLSQTCPCTQTPPTQTGCACCTRARRAIAPATLRAQARLKRPPPMAMVDVKASRRTVSSRLAVP
jgi:hypothetical protein